MIKVKVHETAKAAWYNSVSNPELYRFKMLHCEFSPPLVIVILTG